jgi:hypothetical protein
MSVLEFHSWLNVIIIDKNDLWVRGVYEAVMGQLIKRKSILEK